MLVVQVLSLLAASLVVSAHPRPAKRALPLLGGVNVAGLDFGMDTNGQNNNVYVPPPVAQISHFSKLGANLFRIPFGWQYLTGTSGGNIIDSFFQILDTPVQAALNASPGTYVILDMHNYARFKGLKIGTQVSGADFANTWGQLAAKYKSNPRVMFGLVNEPHDLSDSEFAAFVSAMQLAVNAIRSAGATSQYILLPGNDWDHPNELINKWGDVLINGVTDPNGGSSLLLIDAHQYLDADGSGTGSYCTTDNVDLFKRFAAWLKTKNRQAIVTETGAAWQNADCVTKMNAQLAYIRSVPEQIVGFTAWSAGAFDPDYVLSLVPDANGNDNAMVKGALVPNFPGANAPVITTSSAPVTPSATPVSTSRPPVVTTASSISTSNPPLTSSTSASSTGTAGPWGQCGGTGWTGPTTCTTGWTCKVSNQWYSQCLQ